MTLLSEGVTAPKQSRSRRQSYQIFYVPHPFIYLFSIIELNYRLNKSFNASAIVGCV